MLYVLGSTDGKEESHSSDLLDLLNVLRASMLLWCLYLILINNKYTYYLLVRYVGDLNECK
jgi:hypothetical protein